MTATTTLPTLVIDGIIYQIIKESDFTVTPEMASWCKAPVTRQSLTLKRPRGKRFYHAVRIDGRIVTFSKITDYESGRYSSAT